MDLDLAGPSNETDDRRRERLARHAISQAAYVNKLTDEVKKELEEKNAASQRVSRSRRKKEEESTCPAADGYRPQDNKQRVRRRLNFGRKNTVESLPEGTQSGDNVRDGNETKTHRVNGPRLGGSMEKDRKGGKGGGGGDSRKGRKSDGGSGCF